MNATILNADARVFALFWLVTFGAETFATTDPDVYVFVSALWALNGWSWIVAILGLGRRFLYFKHRLLLFTNELVLPFYILHQTIIVAIAFFIVSLMREIVFYACSS